VTDANRYPAQVFWSDEDEGYIALATDLPGCSAFGETQQEALTELQDAIVAWAEAARAAGNPIPEPSQPAAENHYSGKILVRMPRSLHAELARAAKAEDASLNQYIVVLLTWAGTRRTLEPFFSPPAVHHSFQGVNLNVGRPFHKIGYFTSEENRSIIANIESISSYVEAGKSQVEISTLYAFSGSGKSQNILENKMFASGILERLSTSTSKSPTLHTESAPKGSELSWQKQTHTAST
jgi:predicted RNase H-like HicB family nuclease